jgi:hypothetical protein
VDNSPGATGFELERALDAGFTADLHAVTLPAGQTLFDDSGLDPETDYYYRVRALGAPSPSDYSPATQETTPTRLADWRWVHFGDPAAVGKASGAADPDGDGLPNLLEYACNLDPNVADAEPLAADGTAGIPAVDFVNGHLRITFLQRKAGSKPAVVQKIVFSNNLVAWSTEPTAATTVTPIDDLWERVVLFDPAAAGSRRFVKESVTGTGE